MSNLFRIVIYFSCISSLFATVSFGEDADDDFNGENVRFEKGLLSVNARDMRSEDLMREIGEKCNIEVVVLGEVFSEIPVSSTFNDMPVKDGIKRLLRCSGIVNYLLHFDSGDNSSKIVRLDLIGKKGGEKHLTDRSTKVKKKKKKVDRSERKKIRAERKSRRKKKEEPPISRKEMEELQESFMNVMDDVLKEKFMNGEQPDPAEVLRIFNEAVPPDIREKMPPEVLEQLEGMQ